MTTIFSSDRLEDKWHTTCQYLKRSCFWCNKSTATNNVSLSACSKCRRVVYCGRECQVASWKEHKHVCAAWAAVKTSPDFASSPAPITSYPPTIDTLTPHRKHMQLELYEPLYDLLKSNPKHAGAGKVSNYLSTQEPRCCCCYRVEAPDHKLVECDDCTIFSWCESGGCEALCKDQHVEEGLCEKLLSLQTDEMFIHRYERDTQKDGPVISWAPDRVLSTLKPLPSSWSAYFAANPSPAPLEHPMVSSMFMHSLSIPLTILGAMEKFGLTTKFGDSKDRKPLTVHLAGASMPYELEVAGRGFEEIVHWLPGVKSLDIVLVGPELALQSTQTLDMDTCPSCQRQGRRRTLTMNGATYENYLPTVSISKRPDIIIAFNSGCHENPDSWPPAIVAIIDSKIPACFTSYTAEEAQKDLRVVQDVGGSKVSVKWSEEKNVWSGGRTRFDYWSEERTWSDSALWMGFQGV